MYMLGICYYNGTGVEKSVIDAIWFWNMAHEFGEDNHVCYELGCAYYLGESSREVDHLKAFKFRKYILVQEKRSLRHGLTVYNKMGWRWLFIFILHIL